MLSAMTVRVQSPPEDQQCAIIVQPFPEAIWLF